MQRSCSYCHDVNHNIRQCNNPQIEEKYNTIRQYYRQYYNQNNYRKRLFVNYINLNYDAITIKAIGLKYMPGSLARYSKNEMIELLWEHFNTHHNQHLVILEDILPTVPDEVPEYAQDLIWTIDRTPDRRPDIILDIIQDIRTIYIKHHEINIHFDEQKFKGEQELEKEKEEDDCEICYELTKDSDKATLNCGHKFCGKCIKSCLKVGSINCAMCRCPIENICVKNQQTYELVFEYQK